MLVYKQCVVYSLGRTARTKDLTGVWRLMSVRRKTVCCTQLKKLIAAAKRRYLKGVKESPFFSLGLAAANSPVMPTFFTRLFRITYTNNNNNNILSSYTHIRTRAYNFKYTTILRRYLLCIII